MDNVNHPKHYKSETGLEAIDVIEAFTFDLKGIEAVDTGNVLKYMCRWNNKNGLEDLKKARWYLNHLIDHIENIQKENPPIVNIVASSQKATESFEKMARIIDDFKSNVKEN